MIAAEQALKELIYQLIQEPRFRQFAEMSDIKQRVELRCLNGQQAVELAEQIQQQLAAERRYQVFVGEQITTPPMIFDDGQPKSNELFDDTNWIIFPAV